jgi:hypothetical protein
VWALFRRVTAGEGAATADGAAGGVVVSWFYFIYLIFSSLNFVYRYGMKLTSVLSEEQLYEKSLSIEGIRIQLGGLNY